MADPSKELRRRDLIKWPHLIMRAAWELARARLAVRDIKASDVQKLNLAALDKAGAKSPDLEESRFVERMGFVITFVARHTPWRSDCLPQAIAGQRWLLSKGMSSEIRVGVERPDDGGFGAHAWLVQGERTVTGGDVGKFSVLLGGDGSYTNNASSEPTQPSRE